MNNNNTIAKDPIDFIRNFRFGIYKQNTGTTTGPVREARNLTIRIVDDLYPVVVEVTLTPDQYKTTRVIADWLEKQPLFFIHPYAAVLEQETVNSTHLRITISSFVEKPVMIREHLNSIIKAMDNTRAMMQGGNTNCVRPSYEQDPNSQMNHGGGGYSAQPGQVIGRIVLDDPRTPIGGQSRLPQGHTTGNKNNW
ncbi:hypothetical protein pEaSNUABM37_00206 [Erwinia phage pEa_SNUABM_37]|nr:hypothetical protein pEaSNUABM37_00206 [Erwinia phage pEa_SNUABM_37]QXO10676.1 hypothetical protein pEaSNUABM48_00206 [Erwinia phage pEa_SNUABM_48]